MSSTSIHKEQELNLQSVWLKPQTESIKFHFQQSFACNLFGRTLCWNFSGVSLRTFLFEFRVGAVAKTWHGKCQSNLKLELSIKFHRESFCSSPKLELLRNFWSRPKQEQSVKIKGATKLYFVHFLPILNFFMFCVFCVELEVIFIDFLITIL